MKSFGATFAGFLVIAISVLGLTFGTGLAQGRSGEPAARIVDLELTELEIGKAVAYLFAKVNGKYSLARDVKGVTTVSIRQVPFESALANVLKQVNATWRVRDGIYEIVLKPQDEPIDRTAYAEAERRQHGEDVRIAIWRFMRTSSTPYSVSPDVKGRIKVNDGEFKGLTFEAAFQKLLTKANATVRIEDGFYEILPRPAAAQEQGVGEAGTTALQDSHHLWIRRGEVLYKVRKSDLKTMIERRINAEKVDSPVSLKAQGSDVREVLRSLFKQGESSYSISPEVKGDITIDLRNVSFTTALRLVLRQVDARYEIGGGVYMISPTSPRSIEFNKDRAGIIPSQIGDELILQDDRFVYALTGYTIQKMAKSDLSLVATGRLGQ